VKQWNYTKRDKLQYQLNTALQWPY